MAGSSSTTSTRRTLAMSKLLGRRLGAGGKPERHGRALAHARTGGPQPPAVLRGDPPADVQAQPQAGDVLLGRVRGPAERLEDLLGGPRRQANARVAHL